MDATDRAAHVADADDAADGGAEDRAGDGAGGAESTARAWSDGASDLGILLAGLTGGAGIIHLAMVPEHAGGGSWIDPVGFAVVGWIQIALAVVFLLRRGNRTLTIATAVFNAAALGMLVWARTVGLPFGSHSGIVEEVGLVDGVCGALEAGAIVVAAVMVAAPRRLRVGLLVPSVAAVAVLGLVTMGITSSSASEHSHGVGVDGHSHTDGTDAAAHTAEMSAIDDQRCDLGFNPRSYWDGADAMGVDTYGGGTMAMASAPTLTQQAEGTGPDEGRGSAGLDRLVSATSKASTGGELDAAGLVVQLGKASEKDYGAWVTWMRAQAASGGSGGHSHGSGSGSGSTASSAAPDDNGGHGGHAGPQPWVAMVDQHRCVQLADELARARAVALSMPTAADAVAAGYRRVTPYVPGIAAHYMDFSLVDGKFDVDHPEMVLYDGNGDDARVVGLSYYLVQEGDAEPTQGFTGDDDHYHRHVGLCTAPGGGVIGDSTTTAEACAARGGVKASGTGGWMSHAWVVPGCESPWGVFSGANPLLDDALSAASGQNQGGCVASGVRDRYDLRPGGRSPSGTGESAAGD